jgi:NTE family protein
MMAKNAAALHSFPWDKISAIMTYTPARLFFVLFATLFLAACAEQPPLPQLSQQPRPAPKIALVLGGGAARGFAHVGVIKALEAQGIVPDIVVGTSAGSVVGALYAAGHTGFELQRLVLQMEESQLSDWSLPDRGVLKGEALQNFVNRAVAGRPLEKLGKLMAVVATDLQSGEAVVFRTGNTGMAVRASSSVPGLFQPVAINGREYVDGGLVSPVPVRIARGLGADFVIAVDISAQPQYGKTQSTLDVMLQTFTIMAQTIARRELPEADIVIRPNTLELSATDFQGRHLAVLEGEKAVAAMLPGLKAKLAKLR